MPLSVVILAAGRGKRMNSDLPKVLQPLAGEPLLRHVVRTARELGADRILVVYGHGGEQVPEAFAESGDLEWVLQAEQLGTGHAVMQAMSRIPDDHTVLVLYGDVPLTRAETLRQLVGAARSGGLALLTVALEDAAGYGRILRDSQGGVRGIVEHADASAEQLLIREANTGTAVPVPAAIEALGVNDKMQLAEVETGLRRLRAGELMRAGATLADPARIDVRGQVTVEPDVFIDVGAVLIGRVHLGARVKVGPYCVIRDARIGADTEINANCVIEETEVAGNCRIGPFARLRPGTVLGHDAHIGNFVEVKNSRIGDGSKANHLSYVGDATVGAGVNVGAGTITCNYDGANKWPTVIADGAFIGSGSMLVAPVRIGAGATIGAGSTITESTADGKLTLTRARQSTVENWKRPAKLPEDEKTVAVRKALDPKST